MKPKTFLDQFASMGWNIEDEYREFGEIIWKMKNQDDFQMDVVLQEDRQTFSLRTTIPTPDSVEDVWILWDILNPFIDAEKEKNNYIEWDGRYFENLLVSKYYKAHNELPKNTVDGRCLRGIVGEQLRFHKRVERKLQQAIAKIPFHWGHSDSSTTPDNSIRIPHCGLHGALPSLHTALAFLNKQQEIIYGEVKDCTGSLLCYLDDIVLYNFRYRNYLREYGLDALAEKLVAEFPDFSLEDVHNSLKQMWELIDGKLGDVDIRFMGRRETVEILGETYHGVDDFRSEGKKPAVRSLCRPYPCFDEYDAMYEDRFYRVTCFAKSEDKLPSYEKMKCFLNFTWARGMEEMKPSMLPMVYDNGDSPVVYLITPRAK